MAMTEQELVTALAETGRSIAPRTLSEWRSSGLLPPLASKSKGLRKGKICFWLDDAVFDRVALIHDLLKDGTEKQEIYWLLWLCGFPMPLPQLRRAWSGKAKTSVAWRCRARTPAARAVAPHAAHPLSPRHLLSTVLNACECLDEHNEPEVDALVAALNKQSERRDDTSDPASSHRQRLELKVLLSALRESDLIVTSTDSELLEAQQFTSRALHQFRNQGSQSGHQITPLAPVNEARALGAPLFLLILSLVRSGQKDVGRLFEAAPDERSAKSVSRVPATARLVASSTPQDESVPATA